jgi:hypothetical protein
MKSVAACNSKLVHGADRLKEIAERIKSDRAGKKTSRRFTQLEHRSDAEKVSRGLFGGGFPSGFICAGLLLETNEPQISRIPSDQNDPAMSPIGFVSGLSLSNQSAAQTIGGRLRAEYAPHHSWSLP